MLRPQKKKKKKPDLYIRVVAAVLTFSGILVNQESQTVLMNPWSCEGCHDDHWQGVHLKILNMDDRIAPVVMTLVQSKTDIFRKYIYVCIALELRPSSW